MELQGGMQKPPRNWGLLSGEQEEAPSSSYAQFKAGVIDARGSRGRAWEYVGEALIFAKRSE